MKALGVMGVEHFSGGNHGGPPRREAVYASFLAELASLVEEGLLTRKQVAVAAGWWLKDRTPNVSAVSKLLSGENEARGGAVLAILEGVTHPVARERLRAVIGLSRGGDGGAANRGAVERHPAGLAGACVAAAERLLGLHGVLVEVERLQRDSTHSRVSGCLDRHRGDLVSALKAVRDTADGLGGWLDATAVYATPTGQTPGVNPLPALKLADGEPKPAWWDDGGAA